MDNTRLKACPHSYTSNVCSAELSQAGAAGDQLFSPPTAHAVPHRAAGQTSLSVHHFWHLLDQAEGWGSSAVSLLNHWLVGSVVRTVVGTSRCQFA